MKIVRSQCLGTGMTPFLVVMTRKRGTGMTLKEWELMAKRNTGVASFFVIPVRDAGI